VRELEWTGAGAVYTQVTSHLDDHESADMVGRQNTVKVKKVKRREPLTKKAERGGEGARTLQPIAGLV
jgi:hypothetical protein